MRRLFMMSVLALGGAAACAQVGPGAATRGWRLAGFDRVELRGSDDVQVRVGSGFSVVARGPKEVLDHLEIVVEAGTLKVGRQRSGMWGWGSGWHSGNRHAVVTVTLPGLRGASVAGSGNMMVDHARAPQFGASVAGSGDLAIGRLETETANVSVAGSGDIRVGGRATAAKLSIAGSGDIYAGGLQVRDLTVSTAGSGNTEVSAVGSAKVSLVGSGDVTVHGPAHCQVSKMGSGDVKCGG